LSQILADQTGEPDVIMTKIRDRSRLAPNIGPGVVVYIGYMF